MVQTGATVDVERHSARQVVQTGATARGEVVVVAEAMAMAEMVVVVMAMVVVAVAVAVDIQIRSTSCIVRGRGSRSQCHRASPRWIHRALNAHHTVIDILTNPDISGRSY